MADTLRKTAKMELVELRTGKSLREAMIDAYVQAGSVEAAAKLLRISYPTYWLWRTQVEPPLTEKDLEAAHAAAKARQKKAPEAPKRGRGRPPKVKVAA
ncbi:MAG: hypothetical protein HY678_01705 [Chloroflexi bacterium]|nr:hypothetical protein [Chloroflexota bacterium]